MEAARVPQPEPEAGALLAELFDRHGRMVLGICRAILSDPSEAEDAAQQAFLSAHTALVGGTRPRRPAAWLAAIARNECRSRIASRLARPQAVPLLDDVVESPAAAPEEQAARNAEVGALAAGLVELPGRQREAVLLRDFFGLSYREVAAAMSISKPAVESLLSRGRRRLEDCVAHLHAVQGVLVVPQSLRDQLAALVPGFSAADAVAVSAGGGLAGVLAKLAATPMAGKVAAGVTVGALVVGGEGALERTTAGAEPRAPAARERPAEPAESPAALDRVRPSGATAAAQTPRLRTEDDAGDEAERDRSGPSGETENEGPGSDSSGPGSGSGSGSELDDSGPGSASSGSGSEINNSGPGSVGSGSGSELDDSGRGSDSSGSGSADDEVEDPVDD